MDKAVFLTQFLHKLAGGALLETLGKATNGMVLFACNRSNTLVIEIVGCARGFVVFHDNHLRSLLSRA